MSDEKLLQTIQNDIKNIDKCIEMAISVEAIDYLKSIQENLRKQEIKLVKEMAIKKLSKENSNMATLTYNLPNDIHTYVITCPSESIPTYYKLLRENGAYKILLENEVIYDAK